MATNSSLGGFDDGDGKARLGELADQCPLVASGRLHHDSWFHSITGGTIRGAPADRATARSNRPLVPSGIETGSLRAAIGGGPGG